MPETTPRASLPTNGPSGAVHESNWAPTSIDWSVAFPRSPQHLSNQLRGKRFNAEGPQLELFDTTYRRLPEEIRKDVDRHNIAVVGFDLTIAQQRAYEAGLYLFTATGARHKRIVFTPDDWIRAYGLQKRERNTRRWSEVSSFERDDAFSALISLGMLPWLIQYCSMVHGKWGEVTRVAPLWLCGTRTDGERPSPTSSRVISAQDLAPLVHKFKNADAIELEFNAIWFDQHDTFYFYKPAHLYQRLSLAISGNARRHNRHLHAFVDWIFSEVGRIRVAERQARAAGAAATQPRTDWTFCEDLTALALQLRMTAQVNKRNWSRIREAITNNAALTRDAQIITDFAWIGNQIKITFNQKTFADLDQYHHALHVRHAERAKRRRRPEVQGIQWPFPRPVSEYSPTQLREFKRGQLQRLAQIRGTLREEGTIPKTYAGTMIPRPPTPEELRALEFHQAVVRMIDEALVPSPPPEAESGSFTLPGGTSITH